MSTETNEGLPDAFEPKAEVWIIGTREQVQHIINELYVCRFITDRVLFSPIITAPFHPGKYMSVLGR